MSHLIASLAWCWVQVLLVAAAAIGLSLLALRRSPTAGATIAWSGVIAALALTGLAIVPLPARVMQRSARRAGRQPIARHANSEFHDQDSDRRPSEMRLMNRAFVPRWMDRCLPNCSNRCAIPSRPWCAITARLVGRWSSWQLDPRSVCSG